MKPDYAQTPHFSSSSHSIISRYRVPLHLRGLVLIIIQILLCCQTQLSSTGSSKLPINRRWLPFNCSSLPISYSSLPISYKRLPISYSSLPNSLRRLPFSYSRLPISQDCMFLIITGSSNQVLRVMLQEKLSCMYHCCRQQQVMTPPMQLQVLLLRCQKHL